MRKFGLICFNVLLSIAGATVYAWVVRNDGMNLLAWRKAIIEGGSAGFMSGLVVGLGATLGSRPTLPTKKCVKAQMGNALSSLAGGLIAYLFPRLWTEVNIHFDEALRERGILRGSGLGLIIGTLFGFVQIYFSRRKASR
jgi:hypothetical protein